MKSALNAGGRGGQNTTAEKERKKLCYFAIDGLTRVHFLGFFSLEEFGQRQGKGDEATPTPAAAA